MSTSLMKNRIVLSDEELIDAFKLLDVDQDGELSRHEMCVLLRTINIEPTKNELDFIFEEIDIEDRGKITLDEFVNYMKNPFKALFTKDQIEEIFKDVVESEGGITLDSVKEVVKDYLDDGSMMILEKLFIKADVHNDGVISVNEFLKLMKKMKAYIIKIHI
uniref:EF-hand domain-containing protein n=1 Tax=Strongyloides stercoralis TaxID=6248 RepID=A0AAF5I248_STRER